MQSARRNARWCTLLLTAMAQLLGPWAVDSSADSTIRSSIICQSHFKLRIGVTAAHYRRSLLELIVSRTRVARRESSRCFAAHTHV